MTPVFNEKVFFDTPELGIDGLKNIKLDFTVMDEDIGNDDKLGHLCIGGEYNEGYCDDGCGSSWYIMWNSIEFLQFLLGMEEWWWKWSFTCLTTTNKETSGAYLKPQSKISQKMLLWLGAFFTVMLR